MFLVKYISVILQQFLDILLAFRGAAIKIFGCKSPEHKMTCPTNRTTESGGFLCFRAFTFMYKFSKDILYYTPRLVFKYAGQGFLEEYTIFTLLKKSFQSGHFHSCQKPVWYTRTQSQWYRTLATMQKIGLLYKIGNGRGFQLASLKKLHNKKRECFNPSSTLTKSFIQLKKFFEREMVRLNFLRQLKGIAKKEVAAFHPDTCNSRIINKARKQWFDTLLMMSADGLTMRNDKFKTNLSCSTMGRMFGKSKAYGCNMFMKLHAQGFIDRRKWYTPVHITHQYHKKYFKDLLIEMYDTGHKFYKGMFYKRHSAFMVVLRTPNSQLTYKSLN